MSRVYSLWVNGNETFYFNCTVDEINELLAIFARARLRDHVVRIERGNNKVRTFKHEDIQYNVRLQIVGGIALAATRNSKINDLPLEPELTILTPDDNGAFVRQLKWPKNLIVESEIPGISINPDVTTPKRNFYYGKLEFEDGSPPVEFVKNRSRITLWEQEKAGGISVGSVSNKGYTMLRLSEEELAGLKKGTSWLTVTIGNYMAKAGKSDQRFPVEMLTRDIEQAQAVKVKGLEYYYGRILFLDGSPPVFDSPPWWPGAEIHLDFAYAGSADFDSDGYFKVYFTRDQYERLKAQKPRRNIYVPRYEESGLSTARFTFPPNLLSQDKAKAGVVKIPRPKIPKKELATAESKIGKPIPDFDTMRFEAFRTEQIEGKQLLVCFWDMEQRPSRRCVRSLQEQKQIWEDKNTVVLVVNAGTKRDKEAESWVKKNAPSLTAGTIEGDPHDTLLAWGARGLPWLVLTDKDHVITRAGFNLSAVKQTQQEAK